MTTDGRRMFKTAVKIHNTKEESTIFVSQLRHSSDCDFSRRKSGNTKKMSFHFVKICRWCARHLEAVCMQCSGEGKNERRQKSILGSLKVIHNFALNIVHREPFDVDVIISDLVSLCFQNICILCVIWFSLACSSLLLLFLILCEMISRKWRETIWTMWTTHNNNTTPTTTSANGHRMKMKDRKHIEKSTGKKGQMT